MNATELFSDYFKFVGDTEAPMVFHRWSLLSSVAACLGRRNYTPLGHFKIYPHMYALLIGSSGTRKSSAIMLAKKVLKKSGYDFFSADRTSKEKFVMDLQSRNFILPTAEMGNLSDIQILSTTAEDAEMYIVADELQEFLGLNNTEFITMLGSLWDLKDSFEHRIKTGKSSIVERPVINLLGGSTPTGFAMTFPPEIVGQGFFSRLLLIYGESPGKKIAWPEEPDFAARDRVVDRLKEIRTFTIGKLGISPAGRDAIASMYNTPMTLNDPRFTTYETRRHTHLLKVASILSSMKLEPVISMDTVLEANTVLYYAERRMPLALGEFGKGKFSEVSNAIMEALYNTKKPLGLTDLWKLVAQDLSGQKDLVEILQGLRQLEKIQTIDTDKGAKFLPNRRQESYFDSTLVCPEFLTEEEKVIVQ